jgi:hypothetical protein
MQHASAWLPLQLYEDSDTDTEVEEPCTAGQLPAARQPDGQATGDPAHAAAGSAHATTAGTPAAAAAPGASAALAEVGNRLAASAPAAAQKLGAKAAAAAPAPLLQAQAASYRLHAVVRHKGPLASSGHFVADVLHAKVRAAGAPDPTSWPWL